MWCSVNIYACEYVMYAENESSWRTALRARVTLSRDVSYAVVTAQFTNVLWFGLYLQLHQLTLYDTFVTDSAEM